MNGEESNAIGQLQGTLNALNARMERAETCRSEHHKAIIGRLTNLEALNHFNKGRMSLIGGVFSFVIVAISAAVGALINSTMEGWS